MANNAQTIKQRCAYIRGMDEAERLDNGQPDTRRIHPNIVQGYTKGFIDYFEHKNERERPEEMEKMRNARS